MKTMFLGGICAVLGVVVGSTIPQEMPDSKSRDSTAEVRAHQSHSTPRPSHGEGEGARESKVTSRLELVGTSQVHVITEQRFGTSARSVTGVEIVSDTGDPLHEQLNDVQDQGISPRTEVIELPQLEDGYYIVRASSYAIGDEGQHANHIEELYLVVDTGSIRQISSLDFNNNSDINKAVRQ